jgi:histidine ammonia-lyase
VHGAGRDAAAHVRTVLDIEVNSATDNPLVFTRSSPARRTGRSKGPAGGGQRTGDVIPGGNFHGQPVSAALDYLALAMTSVASISERRTERLVNPDLSGLPAFLVSNIGLNSGYMLAQVTAAALVSENKALSHPASVDSIPTSANREDHVSMGPIAARKAAQVVTNTRRVLAIEMLTAAQALDFLEPLRPALAVHRVHRRIRRDVPHMDRDRVIASDIETVEGLIASGALLAAAEGEAGRLL